MHLETFASKMKNRGFDEAQIAVVLKIAVECIRVAPATQVDLEVDLTALENRLTMKIGLVLLVAILLSISMYAF